MKLRAFFIVALVLFSLPSLAQISDSEVREILRVIERAHQAEIVALEMPLRISFDPNGVKSAEISVKTEWSTQKEARIGFFELRLDNHFAKLKGITRDAFALVMCHELGHVLGGAPIYNQRATSVINPQGFNPGISTEGQSDYFASAKCFKRFAHDVKPEKVAVSLAVRAQCAGAYTNPNDRAICERTISAAEVLLVALAKSKRAKGKSVVDPMVAAKSPEKVAVTFENHSSLQCRLDTFVAGALCDAESNAVVSWKDAGKGYCLNGIGARPSCWFNLEKYERLKH